VRWRIVEQQTGAFHDPRDIADASGTCCQPIPNEKPCAGAPAWRVTRVRIVLADSNTGQEIAQPPAGLDATCSARELTTPFTLPDGLLAISLQAFDPAAPALVEAESPSPQLRTIKKAEIVNLDVVALSVSTQ
jgi:hypothetical protein